LLRVWSPSIVHGLQQTEDYARVLLSVHPDVADEVVGTRLAGRMARQKRLFARDVPMLFLIDQLALYRLVGSPEIMAAQLQHLVTMASRPRVNPGRSSRRRAVRRARDRTDRPRGVLGNERVRQRVDRRGNPFVARARVRYASVRGVARVRVTCTDRTGGRTMDWRKSTYSDSNGGSCVETASGNGVILVRDTTNRDGGTLGFTAAAWQEFTDSLG
jgi:hypothetical protein